MLRLREDPVRQSRRLNHYRIDGRGDGKDEDVCFPEPPSIIYLGLDTMNNCWRESYETPNCEQGALSNRSIIISWDVSVIETDHSSAPTLAEYCAVSIRLRRVFIDTYSDFSIPIAFESLTEDLTYSYRPYNGKILIPAFNRITFNSHYCKSDNFSIHFDYIHKHFGTDSMGFILFFVAALKIHNFLLWKRRPRRRRTSH